MLLNCRGTVIKLMMKNQDMWIGTKPSACLTLGFCILLAFPEDGMESGITYIFERCVRKEM